MRLFCAWSHDCFSPAATASNLGRSATSFLILKADIAWKREADSTMAVREGKQGHADRCLKA